MVAKPLHEPYKRARGNPTGVADNSDRIVGGLLGTVIHTELQDEQTDDDLCWNTYHALVMSHIAYLPDRPPAEGPATGGGAQYPDGMIRELLLRRAVASFTQEQIAYKACSLSGSQVAPTALVRYKNSLFAASRGTTKQLSDFLHDGKIRLLHVADGSCLPTPAMVHTGFFNAFHPQMSEVLDDIDKQIEAGVTSVVFCGHSLGGAVAQLLGLAYAHRRRLHPEDTRLNATVITFGSPRIGNDTMCDRLNESFCHWRLFAHKDPVAGVPSPDTEVINRSVSARQYIAHGSNNNWCLPADGCAQSSESTSPLVKRIVRDGLLRLDEHRILTYAHRLNQHRNACPNSEEAAPAAAGGAAQAPHDA